MGVFTWAVSGIILLAISVASLDLNIVSLLTVDPAIAPALAQTGSALDAAVEAANVRYSLQNITIHVRQVNSILPQKCGDAGLNSARLFAEYYNNDAPKTSGCSAALAMVCNDLPNVYGLAREYGWLVFNNGITPTESVTNPAYPTAFGLAGSTEGLASAVLRFLTIHQWYHITILLDTKATTVLYGMESAAFMKTTKHPTFSSFSAEKVDFSGLSKNSILTALEYAKSRSRVILLLSSATVALDCLKVASMLGMGNGEYVFLNVQIVQMESYGTASQFDNPSPELVNVTRSLFYTTFHEMQAGSESLNALLARRAYIMYNTTFNNGYEPLGSYAVQATYNIVDFFPQLVLAAIEKNFLDPCDSAVLARLAMERSYETTIGRVKINRQKVSQLDVDLYAFDINSRKMKRYAFFDYSTSRFTFAENFTAGWLTGNPPADVPMCGFSGNCVVTDNFLVIAISVPVCVLVALSALLLGLFRRYFMGSRAQPLWWLISDEDIYLPSVTASWHGRQYTPVLWKGSHVWLHSVACDSAQLKRDGKSARKLLRFCLPHQNVCTFYGLWFRPGFVLLVSQYCRRGNLYDVLSILQNDLEFKLSLIMDFTKGLIYLHQQLGPHGYLTPSCGLLDSHFTLKVAKHGYVETARLFGIDLKQQSTEASSWAAPECTETGYKKTKAGDVFSTGLIIEYILSGKQPHPTSPDRVETFAYGSRLQNFIESCMETDPQKRILLSTVSGTVRNIAKNRSDNFSSGNAVEYMLKKMAHYAATLEAAVASRTHELQLEMAKCDVILLQVLPGFVVSRLRARTNILPEYFDSVSVCFSQVDDFSSLTMSMELLQVMETLASMHGIFDSLISSFSVLKIEAVNDSYLVASGIPVSHGNNHAAEVCRMANAHRARIGRSDCAIPADSFLWGIHTGPCAAGIVGKKAPRYLLFGDTVNVASRMMSHGKAGAVHLSESTAQQLATESLRHTRRGAIKVKGKGNMITYWLDADAVTTTTRGKDR